MNGGNAALDATGNAAKNLNAKVGASDKGGVAAAFGMNEGGVAAAFEMERESHDSSEGEAGNSFGASGTIAARLKDYAKLEDEDVDIQLGEGFTTSQKWAALLYVLWEMKQHQT